MKMVNIHPMEPISPGEDGEYSPATLPDWLSERSANPIVRCACGCGAEFHKLDAQFRARRFAVGHNSKRQPVISRSCACGCGEMTNPKRNRQYVSGHNARKWSRNPEIQCACGCGSKFLQRDAQGRFRRFAHKSHAPMKALGGRRLVA